MSDIDYSSLTLIVTACGVIGVPVFALMWKGMSDRVKTLENQVFEMQTKFETKDDATVKFDRLYNKLQEIESYLMNKG